MNLGGNRRWAPLRKSGTNHLILGIGISPTSSPGLFPTYLLREKPWGWGWYLANLRDRGKKCRGRGVRGYSSNPSTWFDKEKKPLALRVFGGSSHCTVWIIINFVTQLLWTWWSTLTISHTKWWQWTVYFAQCHWFSLILTCGVVMIMAPSTRVLLKYWTTDRCSSDVPGGVSTTR